MAIRVLILNPTQARSFDVTEAAEDLQWSNVNPGGHERCTFTLKGSWDNGFPEVRRGSIVRIEDGPKELFTGRVDELDPQLQDVEQVSVTAYGLGVRTKDDTMREIYVDSDLSKWQGPSVARRIALTPSFSVSDPQATFDVAGAAPALLQSAAQGSWNASFPPLSEAWYWTNGIDIGSIYFAWKTGVNTLATDANWQWFAFLSTADNVASGDSSGDKQPAGGVGSATLVATAAGRIWAFMDFNYGPVAGGTVGENFDLFWTCLAVYGRHGLVKQGAANATTPQGFLASQIVADVCSRLAAAGIKARHVSTSDFVITQLVFTEDTAHEDVITAVSKFHDVDWGVWGAETLTGDFSDPTTGYLDWAKRDSSTIDWAAYRDECDEVDLHTEIGSTYNQVAVSYTDPAGQSHRILRTLDSTTLDDANIDVRTATLQGGTLTLLGAQQLGDAFLLLSSGLPVSRGQAIIKGSIKHESGHRPVHFMRADGSNLLIPDAFPDRDSFALPSNASQVAAPQPDNPGFDTDVSGWTLTGGLSFTRDTSNFDSAPAAGLWTTNSPAAIQAEFTGDVFRKGISYTLTARIAGVSGLSVGYEFGNITTGDKASITAAAFSDNVFRTVTLTWTPAADTTGVIFKLTRISSTGGAGVYIDTVGVSTPQPVADRRSVFPIKRVTVDCSGDEPVATVELDQTHDLLSILLARLQLGVGIANSGG